MERGLDRLLWANWSPRASEEVRSLSSMVLHNVRGNPANTTALYKAELRAKRACAILRPGYAAERGWIPPIDPATGAPGPGVFDTKSESCGDVEEEREGEGKEDAHGIAAGVPGGDGTRPPASSGAAGHTATVKKNKGKDAASGTSGKRMKGPKRGKRTKGSDGTKGSEGTKGANSASKSLVEDSADEGDNHWRPVASASERGGGGDSFASTSAPAAPPPDYPLSRTSQKFLKWEVSAFAGVSTRQDKRAARQAAKAARSTPGFVHRLTAAVPERERNAGEGDRGRDHERRSLLGLQSKMRGSPASVLAPVTHDTPGPAAGLQRWHPAVTEYLLSAVPPPPPAPSARERVGMKALVLTRGVANPLRLPRRPTTALFMQRVKGRDEAELYAGAKVGGVGCVTGCWVSGALGGVTRCGVRGGGS